VHSAISRLRPDALHVHFGYTILAVPAVRVPVLTSFYGDDLNGTWTRQGRLSLKSRLGIGVSHWAALRSTRCIAVSEALKRRLWFGPLREKTVVIQDAVDPRVFRPLPQATARGRLQLSDKDVLILFPHNATQPTKRLWLAEAAVQALREAVPDARLWVVNGVRPDDMPLYYSAADAMIVTSVLEGGPSSAKEALACGLPVVSVPVGDRALADEAPDAFFEAEPTAGALAEQLARAIVRASEPRRSRLPPHLTLEAAVTKLETVYRSAIHEVS
jgi:glycosyltransferase involved in cell wall biosynthesis